MDNIAVVGGTGFLGSHMIDARYFRAPGTRSPPSTGSGGKPATRFTSDKVVIQSGDFCSDADLRAVVQGQDYVFHMLSTTTPATAEADPAYDVRTNVTQTVTLLEAAVEAGVKRVYFASTGGAICAWGDQPSPRPTRPFPISPYGIGKLAIERYLEFFHLTHGLDYVVSISNPYGPRQRPEAQQGLIPIALRRVVEGLPVVRLGEGSMVRDYIYVGDVVSAIAPLVEKETQHRVYNVGSGVGRSVNDVLEYPLGFQEGLPH